MYAIEMKADAMLPRERLRDLGAEQLSNQELLSILLRTGTKTRPVLEVANDILKHIDTLADFQHLSLQELQKIKGIGYVKSIEIKAMIDDVRVERSEAGAFGGDLFGYSESHYRTTDDFYWFGSSFNRRTS